MRLLGFVLIATACSAPPHRTSPIPATPPGPTTTPAPAAPGAITWTRIWQTDSRKIDGLWAAPTLLAQQAGAKLAVDVAVLVASVDELGTSDIAMELYAGARRIACGAPEPLGFTETGSINAQASIHCENAALELPTRVVVTIRGARETFDLALTSLTTPV